MPDETKITTVPVTCSQSGCSEAAIGRYTWPGRDEAGICAMHRIKLLGVSRAMGLPLQIIDYEARGLDESYPWESPR